MREPFAPSKTWATRIVDLLTPAVLFGTPLLYVFGRIYSEGYWTTIGFPESVMARQAEDYIYFGFVALVSGLTNFTPRVDSMFVWLAPLMSIGLMAAVALAIWALGKLRKRMKPLIVSLFGQLRDFFSNRRDGLAAIGKASSIVEAAIGLVLILLLGSLVILLPIIVAFSIGKARAEQVHKALAEDIGSRAMVKITSRGNATGHVIDCTDQHCVVFVSQGYLLVARDEIEWIPRSRLTLGSPHQAED